MFNYRNEAMFSNVFVKALRSKNWFVQRIESGTTGKGIPDIYAISPNGVPFWFELKRVHTVANTFDYIGIPWRPGQQAWLVNATKYKQKCYTLACCNNVILKIPHKHLWELNRVHIAHPEIECYNSIAELLS